MLEHDLDFRIRSVIHPCSNFHFNFSQIPCVLYKKIPLICLMVFCHSNHAVRPLVQPILISFPNDANPEFMKLFGINTIFKYSLCLSDYVRKTE
jgi:hypothetical protein